MSRDISEEETTEFVLSSSRWSWLTVSSYSKSAELGAIGLSMCRLFSLSLNSRDFSCRGVRSRCDLVFKRMFLVVIFFFR